MNFSSNRLTLDEAKEIDLVNYLAALGFEPSKIRNNDYWYLSPLRDEKEASFKGITIFSNSNNEVVVFEGFMDFLSFKAMNKNLPENSQDFVILNSISFFERARPFMENRESIRLYFDRDETGQNYTSRALSLSTKYCDESSLYQNYKYLNVWAMNFGKAEKRHLDQKQKH